MRYLCLIYINEPAMATLSAPEGEALMAECREVSADLTVSGHFVAAEKLESVTTATTVRRRDGRLLVTDGPFAETKEQLAGFYLLEARDLNEAIQLAERIPTVRYGSIEVRPVWGSPAAAVAG